MAHVINLKSFTDDRGTLMPLEDKQLSFNIKRVFFIYNLDENSVRGKHRHKTTAQALICVHGSCKVYNNNGKKEEEFFLDSPEKCLILEPEDWHYMYDLKDSCVIQVLASDYFNPDDYIYEPYSSD